MQANLELFVHLNSKPNYKEQTKEQLHKKNKKLFFSIKVACAVSNFCVLNTRMSYVSIFICFLEIVYNSGESETPD